MGRVPVATVAGLLPDSFVKVLVKDGVDVTTVCHIGRLVPAALRSALEARDKVCAVPGCDTANGLEIDHIVPVARGGATRLDNLVRLCHFHHAQKTYKGYLLTGRPGTWVWEAPAKPGATTNGTGNSLNSHASPGSDSPVDSGYPTIPNPRRATPNPRRPAVRRNRTPRNAKSVRGPRTLFDSS